MNLEDKQKAMLADDLSAYIKDKHTQEECIGFTDGYNAAFTKLKSLGIPDVVGQSEQLKAFAEWCDEQGLESIEWSGIKGLLKEYESL